MFCLKQRIYEGDSPVVFCTSSSGEGRRAQGSVPEAKRPPPAAGRGEKGIHKHATDVSASVRLPSNLAFSRLVSQRDVTPSAVCALPILMSESKGDAKLI